jgi:hypothetical protein
LLSAISYQLSAINYQLSAINYHLPLAACGRKTPLFAAFPVLKTRARYVILSVIKNVYSIPAHTHHERSFGHVGNNTRTQAEAAS